MSVFPTHTAEWPRQKEALEAKIAEHQAELETAASFEGVKFIQGQIAALRWLLDAAEPEVREGTGHAIY